MNTTRPPSRLGRLLSKSLTVAVATSALIGLSTSQASADVTSPDGGFAHTEATCYSYYDNINLNVEMQAERSYPYGDQQIVQYMAKFYRWNDATRRWVYTNKFFSQPFYAGYTGYLANVQLSPGHWYIQMEYKWYRGEYGQPANRGAEQLRQYIQDHNSYYGSQTRVNNYCWL